VLRNTSAVALDNTPVLSSDEVVFCTKSIILVDLCRLNVPAHKHMKARVFGLIFLNIEIVTTEPQFVTNFIRHESAIHFLLELIDTSILLELQLLSVLGEGVICVIVVPHEKLVVRTKVIIMVVSEGLIVVVHDYSII
jgi:hypothetical protein